MPEIIVRSNLWATIDGATTTTVDEALSYRPQGYRWSGAYKSGRWDGISHVLKQRQDGNYFPAGLVSYVTEYLSLRDQLVTVKDHRREPERCSVTVSSAPCVTPDPHQEQAVTACLEGHRGIVYYPTGTGKSIIMAEVVRRLAVPTLILCDKKALAAQLHREMERLVGYKVGRVGDGRWDIKPITVATYQSIAARLLGRKDRHPQENAELKQQTLAELQQFHCVIADEAHHVAAPTFEAVMKALPEAYFRYAFSATAFKSGDKETLLRLEGWTGPVIAHLSIAEGIETGRIVPADLWVVSLPKLKVDSPEPINYKGEVDTYIVNNTERNRTILRMADKLRQTGPTVIIVERTAHGQYLADNLDVPYMHGATPAKEREVIRQAFIAGYNTCVIVSKVGDEGLDLPNIKYLILAAGGKAQHRQIQRIGRALRSSGEKDRALVFDFADNMGRHLPRHYRSRRRLYDGEEAYFVMDIEADELEKML